MKLHRAGLENRADRDRELLLAVAAATETHLNALDGSDPTHAAAVGAHRTVSPDNNFQPSEGCGLILEEGGCLNPVRELL